MDGTSSGNLTDGLSGLDFAAVAPDEFARIVKNLSATQLAEVMRGELRTRILGEIFGRMKQQFRPEAAAWPHRADPLEDHRGERCRLRDRDSRRRLPGHPGRSDAEPRTTLVMGDAEFLKLVSGNGNPVTMFMTRKLKVAGDVGLASGLTRYFDIPKA